MWLLILFDLPTETREERKIYSDFRKKIVKLGFTMYQFSIYWRHCSTLKNSDLYILRVKRLLPTKGNIAILRLTDKQFESMLLYQSKKEIKTPKPTQQLEIF